MSFNFHTNHHLLLISIAIGFITLSMIIAVLPARFVQNNNPPLPGASHITPEMAQGLEVFVAEGCVACHTQQVRNISIDKTWGDRPAVPGDLANNKRLGIWRSTPSLLGTERTGPDLTNIGARQGTDWHLIHLYNPRAVVEESIMPSYPWLFKTKEKAGPGDKVVSVPEAFRKSSEGVIVATQRAEYLVAYLHSLKQVEIPASSTPEFIEYDWMKPKVVDVPANSSAVAEAPSLESRLDAMGPKLYKLHCQACHQANGAGIPNAFPPLKGSPIVLNQKPDEMISIILRGRDKPNKYGAMPGLGERLSDEQIAAIVNYERNQWGNKAAKTTPDHVKTIRDQNPLKP